MLRYSWNIYLLNILTKYVNIKFPKHSNIFAFYWFFNTYHEKFLKQSTKYKVLYPKFNYKTLSYFLKATPFENLLQKSYRLLLKQFLSSNVILDLTSNQKQFCSSFRTSTSERNSRESGLIVARNPWRRVCCTDQKGWLASWWGSMIANLAGARFARECNACANAMVSY